MKINVQHKLDFDFITVYEKYDDIIVNCNNGGAEEEYVPDTRFDQDSHEYVDDGYQTVVVCDKCDMQLVDGQWL